jgi:hypothetical protein
MISSKFALPSKWRDAKLAISQVPAEKPKSFMPFLRLGDQGRGAVTAL